jgi:hypothetical protein
VNPVLTALVVTAILLLVIVFAVLVALYKRHQKPARQGTAVVCKAPPPCNNGGGIVIEARRVVETDELLPAGTAVGAAGDADTDPDVIPSKHGRRKDDLYYSLINFTILGDAVKLYNYGHKINFLLTEM